jgi:hypothetical protein
MSSGLCPCGWKGSEWCCAKYLEHQHAISENKIGIPNNPNNKNDPNPNPKSTAALARARASM